MQDSELLIDSTTGFSFIAVFKDGYPAFNSSEDPANIFLMGDNDEASYQQGEDPVHHFMLIPYP